MCVCVCVCVCVCSKVGGGEEGVKRERGSYIFFVFQKPRETSMKIKLTETFQVCYFIII